MPVGRLLSVFAFEVSPQQVAPFTGGRAEFGCESEHFIFVITGRVSKIEQFISIMRPLGLVEICRTGIAAMNRGPQGM